MHPGGNPRFLFVSDGYIDRYSVGHDPYLDIFLFFTSIATILVLILGEIPNPNEPIERPRTDLGSALIPTHESYELISRHICKSHIKSVGPNSALGP